jgi:hypothetical protein
LDPFADVLQGCSFVVLSYERECLSKRAGFGFPIGEDAMLELCLGEATEQCHQFFPDGFRAVQNMGFLHFVVDVLNFVSIHSLPKQIVMLQNVLDAAEHPDHILEAQILNPPHLLLQMLNFLAELWLAFVVEADGFGACEGVGD